jgi:hypothetical protein
VAESLERVVRLYDEMGQKDKADEWRKKLKGDRLKTFGPARFIRLSDEYPNELSVQALTGSAHLGKYPGGEIGACPSAGRSRRERYSTASPPGQSFCVALRPGKSAHV